MLNRDEPLGVAISLAEPPEHIPAFALVIEPTYPFVVDEPAVSARRSLDRSKAPRSEATVKAMTPVSR